MSSRTKNIVIVLLLLIVLAVIARYIIFRKNFETWEAGLARIGTRQTQYKAQHPNATKEEMNAAFKADMNALSAWKKEYIAEHPGATDADADKAFNDAWSGVNK